MEGFIKNIDESEYTPLNEVMGTIDEDLKQEMEELANKLVIKTFRLLELKDNAKHEVIFNRIRSAVLSLSVNISLFTDKRIRTMHCKHDAKLSLIETQTLFETAKQLGYLTTSAMKPIDSLLEKLSNELFTKNKRTMMN